MVDDLILVGSQRSAILLFVLGAVSFFGYCLAAFYLDFYTSAQNVAAFLGLWAGLFLAFATSIWVVQTWRPAGRTVPISAILVWAVAFRLVMLFAGLPHDQPFKAALEDMKGESLTYERFLIYDHDVWRYLWDGHVSAAGFDPYALPPATWMARAENGDPQALSLFVDDVWHDIYDHLGYASYTTVYPPIAQAMFRVSHYLAPGSVWMHKLLVVALDVTVCWLLVLTLVALKRSTSTVLLYAWNPLVIKEFAGSGHVDPLMLCFLLAAIYTTIRQKHGWAILNFGLAVLAKLSPIILLPFFLRRWPRRWWPLLPLPILLGYGYFFESLPRLWQGLATFASEWVFNPGPWAIFHWLMLKLSLPTQWASLLSGSVLLLVGVIGWRHDSGDDKDLVRIGFALMASLLLLSPAVMPWYLPWALVLGVLAGDRCWLFLTFLALGSYLIYMDQVVRTWWLWIEYGLFFAFTGLLYRRHLLALIRPAS